jgi:hypothetical protein
MGKGCQVRLRSGDARPPRDKHAGLIGHVVDDLGVLSGIQVEFEENPLFNPVLGHVRERRHVELSVDEFVVVAPLVISGQELFQGHRPTVIGRPHFENGCHCLAS